MQSKATTVAQYLAELPQERRVAMAAVRKIILQNLDKDYEEGMQYGGIGYYVPHRVYPAGYHCDPKQPVPFTGLASQKNYMSLYLMSCYAQPAEEAWLKAEWAKAGKKLSMGKCCIRFKRLDELPLAVIGEAIRRVPAKKYLAHYEAVLKKATARATRKSAAASRSRRASKPLKSARRRVKS